MEEKRQQLESSLKHSLFLASDGLNLSRSMLAAQLVMDVVCPAFDGSYRWSATSNYERTCLRALSDSRPQPPSRSKWLSRDDRTLIWQLVQDADSFWNELLALVSCPDEPRGQHEKHIHRNELMLIELGERLFAVEPVRRRRRSVLAA
jgi:hypothetical protein